MPGIVQNLPRGPLLDDLTRVQDGDTMSEGSRGEVVGAQDHAQVTPLAHQFRQGYSGCPCA